MKTEMKKVYLDNMATTPVLPEVRYAMVAILDRIVCNPSCLHEWGDVPRDAMEMARGQVADLIGGNPEEIIFTGSGTESNNMALKGLAMAQQKKGKHIVVSAIEHFSVLNSAKTLEKWDLNIPRVPVDKMVLLTRKMSGKQSVRIRFWYPSCMLMGKSARFTY